MAQVNPDVLFNGPYLAFGREATSAPLTWVNLIYHWNAVEGTSAAEADSFSPRNPVRGEARSLDEVVEEEDEEAEEDEPQELLSRA